MTDIDAIEYRYRNGKPEPVALIEEKRWHVTDEKYIINSQTELVLKLSRALGAKFFYVWPYGIKPVFFRLWDVTESGMRRDYLRCCRYVSERELRGILEAL